MPRNTLHQECLKYRENVIIAYERNMGKKDVKSGTHCKGNNSYYAIQNCISILINQENVSAIDLP